MWKFFTKYGQEKTQDALYLPICKVIYDKTLAITEGSFDISIPAGYSHLKLVVSGRGTIVDTDLDTKLRFNGDTGNNYDFEYIGGLGASASAGESFGQSAIIIGLLAGSTAPAGLGNSIEVDIPDHSSTTFNKTLMSRNARKRGVSSGDMLARHYHGFWRSSAAINSITIFPTSGSFVAGSRVTVYGYSTVTFPSLADLAGIPSYALTNVTPRRTLDANSYTMDQLADLICTFIQDVKG